MTKKFFKLDVFVKQLLKSKLELANKFEIL